MNYEILNEIGKGSYSTVYRVKDENHAFSMKVIPLDRAKKTRIQEEIRNLELVKKCTRICIPLNIFVSEANSVCIVMKQYS
mgnify:CR=1 FL=1